MKQKKSSVAQCYRKNKIWKTEEGEQMTWRSTFCQTRMSDYGWPWLRVTVDRHWSHRFGLRLQNRHGTQHSWTNLRNTSRQAQLEMSSNGTNRKIASRYTGSKSAMLRRPARSRWGLSGKWSFENALGRKRNPVNAYPETSKRWSRSIRWSAAQWKLIRKTKMRESVHHLPTFVRIRVWSERSTKPARKGIDTTCNTSLSSRSNEN